MKKGNDDLKLILDRLEEIAQLLRGNMISPWLTTQEAATFLRCSLSKIDEMTKLGLLPFRRLDPTATRSPRLYHRRDLTAFLVTSRNPRESRLSPAEKRLVETLL